jgi:hypothetical protein
MPKWTKRLTHLEARTIRQRAARIGREYDLSGDEVLEEAELLLAMEPAAREAELAQLQHLLVEEGGDVRKSLERLP